MAAKHSQVIREVFIDTQDLKLIHGIGQAYEKCLHQAGITSYSRLANSYPEELVRILANFPGISVVRIREQDWIGQASRLANESETLRGNPVKTPGTQDLHYASYKVEFLLDINNLVRRTQIENIQNKEDTASWAGWDEIRLCEFLKISAKLNIPVQGSGLDLQSDNSGNQKLISPVKTKDKGDIPNHTLKGLPIVQGVRLSSGHDELLADLVNPFEPFCLSVNLDLTSVKNPTQENLYFRVTLYSRPIGSRHRSLVGKTEGILTEGEFPVIELQAAPLPPGDYILDAVITLRPARLPDHPTNQILGYMDGNHLHVG
jgi:hypothetical protein